jgi:hypothetical protein
VTDLPDVEKRFTKIAFYIGLNTFFRFFKKFHGIQQYNIRNYWLAFDKLPVNNLS